MKSKEPYLSFPALVAIAAGGAVAGIFSSIGLATEQTGRSAWIAYGLAVLIGGVLRAFPILVFTSMFRYRGGNYTMTTMALGPLAGGLYALWWLPMFLSRGTTASALGQYIHSIFPQTSPIWVSVILTTLAFLVNLLGIKAMTRLQRPLTAAAVVALVLFTLMGLQKLQLGAFAITSPDYYLNRGIGLLLAITLVIQPTSSPSLICGFSWEAKNPRRSIPLAILASAALVFLVFVGVSFVAANALPEAEMAGKPMTYAARQILPGVLFPLFLFFGPVLSLCSGLNSGMASISAPVLAAIRSGWLPQGLGRTNRYGSPWIIYTTMWLICVIPLILGVSLKTFAAYTVMTQRISGLLLLLSAFQLPKKFPQQWRRSFLHMPNWLYYGLLALDALAELGTLAASVAASSLPIFIGNLLLVGVLSLYAWHRYKSQKPHIRFQIDPNTDTILER